MPNLVRHYESEEFTRIRKLKCSAFTDLVGDNNCGALLRAQSKTQGFFAEFTWPHTGSRPEPQEIRRVPFLTDLTRMNVAGEGD